MKDMQEYRGYKMKIWLYGRENSNYMWGNLGEYQNLDKNLLIKLYGRKNLLCVLSDKRILTDKQFNNVSKWHIKYGNS